jgi:hypothetical protein
MTIFAKNTSRGIDKFTFWIGLPPHQDAIEHLDEGALFSVSLHKPAQTLVPNA